MFDVIPPSSGGQAGIFAVVIEADANNGKDSYPDKVGISRGRQNDVSMYLKLGIHHFNISVPYPRLLFE